MFHAVRRSRRPAVTVAIAIASVTAGASSAMPLGPIHVVVRVHIISGTSTADRARAADTVRQVLQAAGITVTWRDCSLPVDGHAESACGAVLAPEELVIRLVAAPSGASVHVLGYSFIDVARRQGTLATVYTDRVAALAQAAGVEPGTLMGRAVAHEIVHLLLGSRRHTRDGLMRRRWDAANLRRDDAGQWSISPRESAALRKSIQARVATAPLLVAREGSASVADDDRKPR